MAEKSETPRRDPVRRWTLIILAAMAGFFLPGLRRLDNLDVLRPPDRDRGGFA